MDKEDDEPSGEDNNQLSFHEFKADPGRPGLESVFKEIIKLKIIHKLELSDDLYQEVPLKVLKKYKQRVVTEDIRELRRHPEPIWYTLLSAFFYLRRLEIIDSLIELLIQIIHRIGARAERRVERTLIFITAKSG